MQQNDRASGDGWFTSRLFHPVNANLELEALPDL